MATALTDTMSRQGQKLGKTIAIEPHIAPVWDETMSRQGQKLGRM